LIIDYSGNVGIGTSSPAYKLDVNGQGLFRDTLNFGPSVGTISWGTMGGGTGFGIRGESGRGFSLGANGSWDYLVINTSGNVGIGTTSPTAKLHIYNGSSHFEATSNGNAAIVAGLYALQIAPLSNRDSTAGSYYGGIAFNHLLNHNGVSTYNGAPQAWIGTRLQDTAGSERDYLVFATKPGTGTSGTGNDIPIERMCIDRDGLVGIGTTSPAYKLDVIGPATSNGVTLRLSDAASLANSRHILLTRGSVSGSIGIAGSQTEDPLWLSRSSGYDLIVASSGNIGIGTSIPGALLEISSSTVASLLNVKGAGGNGILFVSGSGLVGIGTSSPSAKLEIVGFSTGAGLKLNYGNSSGTIEAVNFIANGAANGVIGMQMVSAGVGDLWLGGSGGRILTLYRDGNVGIGTSSPAYTLDVSGNLRISGSGSTVGTFKSSASSCFISLVDSSGDSVFLGNDDGDFLIQTPTSAYSTKLIVKDDGNVGIGTSVVGQNKLMVYNSISATDYTASTFSGGTGYFDNKGGISIYNPNSTANNFSAIDFYIDQTNYSNVGAARIVCKTGTRSTGGTFDTSLIFLTHNQGGSWNQMLLDNSGNLGIGTTNPVAKLQVAGNISGSSFTSSISNAVGFLGTSSWAQNVVSASYALTSSFATTAQTANALNTGNSYTISGLTNNSTLSQQGTLSMGSGYQILATTGTAPIPGISFVGDTNTGIYAPSADTLGFSISGSERVRITNDGNVGIGTTNPLKNLQINAITASIRLEESSAGSKRLEFSIDSSAVAKISANQSGQSIAFETVGSERVRIDANGNVGIGQTSPASKLHVVGSSFITGSANTSNVKFEGGGGNGLAFGTIDATSTYASWIQSGYVSNFGTATYNLLLQPLGGNVGINTTSPSTPLAVQSNAKQLRLQTTSGPTSYFTDIGARYDSSHPFTIEVANGAATATEYFGIYADGGGANNRIALLNGNVGIGTTAPAAKLEITGSSNSVLMNIKSPISGAILYVSGSGAVGIGTSNVGAYTLQVSGSFAATTKSFVIEHPTKAGKKLIYGSLESPYHGIRLTGRDTLVNGKCKIQLPDYIYKLILHDSVNIQLTGIKCNKTLYVDEINIPENYFTIAYDKAIFESYKDYDFFWDFTGIRADVPELTTEL
jgi:hypothetical protein